MSRLRLHHVILLPLVLLVLAAMVLAVSTLSLRPTVPHPGPLSDAERRQVEQWLADNSPSRFQASGEGELSLTASELGLLATFAFANVPQLQDMAARFELEDDQGEGWLSVPASIGPVTLYLNLHAGFAQELGRARLIWLRAGYLPVPRQVMRAVEQLAGMRLETAGTNSQELAELRHNINATALSDGMLHVRLNWEPDILSRLRLQAQQIFVSAEDRERILAYHSAIDHLVREQLANEERTVSLQAFLPALFELAYSRSGNGDATAENRSLLQALSAYVTDQPLSQLIDPLPEGTPAPPALRVTLYRRVDLSQHFITSAALAASAGAGIAEVLTNTKEVYDARYRTGFSFSDLTANVAGMTLGETATGNERDARRIQALMRAATSESDYIPRPSTDADGLNESDFIEAFQDRNSPRYLERIAEIEVMVAALPVYTNL